MADLQEQLAALRESRAPLPLRGMAEISQALRLRDTGMTYAAIAKAMTVYHGSSRSGDAWRHHLREHGAGPKHHPNSLRLAPQQREASNRGSDGWPARERRAASPIDTPAAHVLGHHQRAAGVQS